MTKPWEETWGVTREATFGVSLCSVVNEANDDELAKELDEPHARLIAQAPAMARLLMRVLDLPGAKHEIGAWAELSPEIKSALRAAGVLP